MEIRISVQQSCGLSLSKRLMSRGIGVAHTLFVNQVPFTATNKDVASFFAEAAHTSADALVPFVRMLNKPGRDGVKVFSGACFVDMPDAEVLQQMIRLA